MSEQLMAQMYSWKPLEKEVRSSFEIPACPYTYPEGREYLRELGIVFYRDSEHSTGVVLKHEDFDIPLGEPHDWVGYRSIVALDDDLTPTPWQDPPPEDEGAVHTFKKMVKKNGDSFAWLVFNEEKNIKYVSRERVARV